MELNQDYTEQESISHKTLRDDANYIGFLLIAVTVASYFSFQVLALGMQYIFGWTFNNSQPYLGIGLVRFMLLYGAAYAISMGGSAALVSAVAGGKRRRSYRTEEKASSIGVGSLLLALLAGLTVCVIANIIASYLMSFAQAIGIERPEMPTFMDKSLASLGLSVLTTCILPALLEELVFRHYILRSLLKYGTGFAIVVSSLLFGLIHGNILQIPFAFIVGLACAYLTVKTGSIWPAVMLHFLNNFMSTLLQYATQFTSEEQSQRITLFVLALVAIIGLFSIIGLSALNSPLLNIFRKSSFSTAAGQAVAKTGKAAFYAKGLGTAIVFLISITVMLVLTIISIKVG